jgi:CheY-like chemotaxis protein
MATILVKCPKCGKVNDSSTETCTRCGIGLQWALEHWSKYVSGPRDLHSPLILFAEIERDGLTLLKIIFDRAGYRVAGDAIGDPLETIRLAECLQPDLIITDVTKLIGTLDGIEMIRRIKANAATQDIPVIVYTANSRAETIAAAIEAGAVKYLEKVMQFQDLVSAVRLIVPS